MPFVIFAFKGEKNMEKYMDKNLTPEERAADLLPELSLEEKVYQVSGEWMQFVDEPGKVQYGIGQLSGLELRRCKSLDEATAWIKECQDKVMKASPHNIPAAVHMEGLCGAFIQDAMSFPSGVGRGSSFDPELEEQVGRIVARQEKAAGITQMLAPVLDVSQDPRFGREGESYGEDPFLAGSLGQAFVKGAQERSEDGRQLDTCAKHFLGFHKPAGGIHGAEVSVGERELREKFGKPFKMAVQKSNLRGVMPCYCAMNGNAASSNKKMLTDVLRNEYGFDGQVLADYGAVSNQHSVQHMYETMDEAGYAAMKAGMDVELPQRVAYNDELIEKFRIGEYDMAVLDRAVMQSLTARFRQGLFENPYPYAGEKLKKEYYGDIESDRAVSLQSAKESIVLLKNDGILPISRNHGEAPKKITIVGPQGWNARFFFGGYTHLSMMEAVYAVGSAMAGVRVDSEGNKSAIKYIPGTKIQDDDVKEMDDLLTLQKPDCRSLYQVLKEMLPETEIVCTYGYPIAGEDCSNHEAALEAMQGADLVIFMLGGKHGSCSVSSMGEGVDAVNVNLPACQDILLEKAAKFGIPMVGIHMNGRPISSDIADETLNAIIEAWNPSEMGGIAIAETLFGINNPSGKMPVTTVRCAAQVPLQYNMYNGSAWTQGESIGFPDYVDMTHRPRYCFGHGLSYTTFEYSDLSITAGQIKPDQDIIVSFTLKNTGKVKGTEIVQLYLRDIYASMVRPIKELKGFARVELKPGESKTVTLSVPASEMAFLDEDMRWKVEKGDIEVQIGSSSEDIRLSSIIKIVEDKYI